MARILWLSLVLLWLGILIVEASPSPAPSPAPSPVPSPAPSIVCEGSICFDPDATPSPDSTPCFGDSCYICATVTSTSVSTSVSVTTTTKRTTITKIVPVTITHAPIHVTVTKNYTVTDTQTVTNNYTVTDTDTVTQNFTSTVTDTVTQNFTSTVTDTITQNYTATITETATQNVTETATVTLNQNVTTTETDILTTTTGGANFTTTETDVVTTTTGGANFTSTETDVVTTTIGGGANFTTTESVTATVTANATETLTDTVTRTVVTGVPVVSVITTVITNVVVQTNTRLVTTTISGTVVVVTQTSLVTVTDSSTVVVATTLPAVTIQQASPVTATVTVVETQSVSVSSLICEKRYPAAGDKTAYDYPSNYTWGCPPKYLCVPTNRTPRSACPNEPPPSALFACNPEDCIPVPQLKGPQYCGTPITSNETCTSYFNNYPYYNLDVRDWGIPLTVFTDSVISKRELVKRQLAGIDQALLSAQNVDPCYDDCNAPLLEAQRTGKIPGLCQPDSAFSAQLAGCNQCMNRLDTSRTLYGQLAYNDISQFITYCNGLINAPQAVVTPKQTAATTGIPETPTPAIPPPPVSTTSSTPVASSSPSPSTTYTPSPTKSSTPTSSLPSITYTPPPVATGGASKLHIGTFTGLYALFIACLGFIL